jgi:outer membrane protein assembly factor BamB
MRKPGGTARGQVPRVLDPQGIYGTRSATRRRIAQRRRLWQNALCLLLALLLVAAAVAWLRTPRAPSWRALWLRSLPGAVSATPVSLTLSGRTVLLAPTDNGQLLAIDADTGAWRAHAVSAFPLRTSPAVNGSRAFIGGEDGSITALDLLAGRKLWSRALSSSISARPQFMELPPPPPSADAPRSPSRLLVVGCDDGLVSALRANDGTVAWTSRMDGPPGNGLSTLSGQGRVTIFVPVLAGRASRGGVQALDAATGRVLWRYPADRRVFGAQLAPPLVLSLPQGPRVVCVDDAGAVAMVDARTGKRSPKARPFEWKSFVAPLSPQEEQAVSLRFSPHLVRSGAQEAGAEKIGVGLAVAGNDGAVRGLDLRTGAPLWSFDTGARIQDVSVPQDVPSRLACATSQGGVWLDAADGRLLARFGPSSRGSRSSSGDAESARVCVVRGSKGLRVFYVAGDTLEAYDATGAQELVLPNPVRP